MSENLLIFITEKKNMGTMMGNTFINEKKHLRRKKVAD